MTGELFGNAAMVTAVLTLLGTALTLIVKAGPGWNASMLNQARNRANELGVQLEACEASLVKANRRAERYYLQLVRAGVEPFDEVTLHGNGSEL